MRLERTKDDAVAMGQRSLLLRQQCNSKIFCNETDDGGVALCLVEDSRSEPRAATRLDQPRACAWIRLLGSLYKEHWFQTAERDFEIFREWVSIVHSGQDRMSAHAGALELSAV